MTHVSVDGRALLKVRASSVLAVDPSIFSRGVELRATAPFPTTLFGEDKDGGVMPVSVAIVAVHGPLAQRASEGSMCGYVDGYDRLAARFQTAIKDPKAQAVLLVIDSPGGDVAGLEEAVAAMVAARDASGKPVHVYVDELAASAAYWIAATVGTDITAPAAAYVGSIGCIGTLVDETGALEKDGLKVTLIREPEGKAASNSLGPVTELAVERTTELVNAAAGRFYEAVSAGRKRPPKYYAGLNGAVLGAKEALAAGLIDAIGGRNSALERVTAAVAARKRTMNEQEKAAARLAEDRELAAMVRLGTGKDSLEEVRGAYAAQRANATRAAELDATEAVRLADEAKAKAARDAADKTALIESMIESQKINPTQRAWAESESLGTLKAFDAFAQSRRPAKVTDAKADLAGAAVAANTLTAEEAQISAMLGVSATELAASRVTR